MSSPESSRTDIASNIKIIPIQSKKKFPAPFKSGAFGQVTRFDANRGITESSREYMAERTESQLHPVASAANLDISTIRDTMLHMNNVMAKNTGPRIAAVTDVQDAQEEEEDRLGRREGTGVAAEEPNVDVFGINMVHPTAFGGNTWYSTTFATDPERSYGGPPDNPIDTYDTRLSFEVPEWNNSTVAISAGEIEVSGDSPRIFVEGPWENSEITTYVRLSFPTPAQPDGMYVHVGARSNHEVRDGNDNKCGFGRYVAKFEHHRPSGAKVACDKETLHPIHIMEEQDTQLFPGADDGYAFHSDRWVGIKMTCRTIAGTNKVQVDGYTDQTGGLNGGDWVWATSWIDDGTVGILPEDITTNQSYIDACMPTDDPQTILKVDGQPPAATANLTQTWMRPGKHCWWRTEHADKVRFKWMSVREIDPLPPEAAPPEEEVPEVDVFGVLKMFPTTTGGDEWFSTAWQNGVQNERFLGEGDTDPMDSRLMYSNGDPDTTEIRIDGNSHLWQTEYNDSCRLFISGNWLNTEHTIFMRREAGDLAEGTSQPGDGIQLRSRADHNKGFAGETPDDCGWGNYEVKWNDRDNEASVEVEPLHSIYRRHLGSATFNHTFDIGVWKGFKMLTRTKASDDHVVVEGYYCTDINRAGNPDGWEKVTEFEFNGTNSNITLGSNQARADSCFNKGDHQVSSTGVSTSLDAATLWNNTGIHCWMRANGFNNVRWKWYSVREIDEIGAPPVTIQTDAFGTKKLYADKAGGASYAATSWTNGTARTINRDTADSASTCYNDPSDSRFKMTGVGDPRVVINGSGIMKATVNNNATGSPRVVVTGNFQNVESTVYFRFPSGFAGNFDLRGKTDHYCSGMGDDGFGGYWANANFTNQTVNVRKEKTHAIGYGPSTDIQAFTFLANKWYGIKTVIYNTGSNVKVEGWLDTTDGLSGGGWVKITEGTDDGTWQGTPDQLVCGFSGLRTNVDSNNSYVEYKKWSVREIIPTLL